MIGAATAVGASTRPTYLFRGKKNVGYIQDGNIQCVYEGAQAVLKGSRLIIRSALGSLMLTGNRINANRWTVRAHPYSAGGSGVIVKRTASRWQAWRGHRKIGYAVGPEALEGAAALVSPC